MKRWKNILVCRTEHDLNEGLRKKLAMFCDIDYDAVIEAKDASTIYEIPLIMEKEGLADVTCKKLGIENKKADLAPWEKIVYDIKNPQAEVKIAVVGKYVELKDAYISINESLEHAAYSLGYKARIKYIQAENLDVESLKEYQGILVPGGFGNRGVEGKIAAIKYVTGEYLIRETTYYFTEDGKFDKEKNQINPNNPMVALTFDDGPGPYTLQLLEGLEANQAKATFFVLGSRAAVYPEALKRMVDIGCEIGNHSKSHVQLTQVSNAVVNAEISETNDTIRNACEKNPLYLRPPYGSSDNRVRAIANMPVVLWSVDTLDWKSKDVEQVKQAIRSTIKDGDIVLMHDIYQTTVDAILQLIPELKEQGYQFVTVSELAANRGVTLESGKIYRYFYK